MQHLDEGTIHSWLDGALSAEESARVSAHVAECPQCAAAVAEARGFIAASSRILTALDHVPGDVVPVGARPKPRNWAAWRAAAAVLVVALGSFAVLRERMGTRGTTADTVTFRAASARVDTVVDRGSTDTMRNESLPTNQAPSVRAPAQPTTAAFASPSVASKAANQQTPRQDRIPPPSTAPQSPSVATDAGHPARENSQNLERAGAAATRVGVGASRSYEKRVSEPLAGSVASGALSTPAPAVMSDSAVTGPTTIRVVGTPRVPGEKRTLYEIAPGDTVLLAEMSTTQLSAVVTAKAAAPAPSVETLNGVTTLTWTDRASGNSMKLSGRHSYAELVEIRRRIERARAAEAAANKTK